MAQISLFDSPTPSGSQATHTLASPVSSMPYELNPDGWSVKGCSIIYAPSGQAGEYAKLATNPYRGCSHRCSYCYVPKVIQISRQEFDEAAVPRPDYLKKLKADARKYQACGITEQVMLSFTTDPFNPSDMSLTHHTLQILQHYGMGICTLTKGGSRALTELHMFRPDRDAFASTLTSLDDAFSAKWESGAAPASDRIATLKKFHEAGIFTWVSLEPTLDMHSSLSIIRECHGFVDLFKIGRANYIKTPKPIDWQEYTHRAIDLCNRLGVKHYIKQDLQGFLPPEYHNPRYVEQHF